MDDLAGLENLSQESLEANLKARYDSKQIYTWVCKLPLPLARLSSTSLPSCIAVCCRRCALRGFAHGCCCASHRHCAVYPSPLRVCCLFVSPLVFSPSLHVGFSHLFGRTRSTATHVFSSDMVPSI